MVAPAAAGIARRAPRTKHRSGSSSKSGKPSSRWREYCSSSTLPEPPLDASLDRSSARRSSEEQAGSAALFTFDGVLLERATNREHCAQCLAFDTEALYTPWMFCIQCGESYHQACALYAPADDHPIFTAVGPGIYPPWYWKCASCRECSQCRTTAPSQVLICRACKRECCSRCESDLDVSDGFYYTCDECREERKPMCIGCAQPVASFTTLICTDCASLEACPRCRMRYQADDEEQMMIACDGCNLWTHAQCAGIDAPAYRRLSKDPTATFLCLHCEAAQLASSGASPAARDAEWPSGECIICRGSPGGDEPCGQMVPGEQLFPVEQRCDLASDHPISRWLHLGCKVSAKDNPYKMAGADGLIGRREQGSTLTEMLATSGTWRRGAHSIDLASIVPPLQGGGGARLTIQRRFWSYLRKGHRTTLAITFTFGALWQIASVSVAASDDAASDAAALPTPLQAANALLRRYARTMAQEAHLQCASREALVGLPIVSRFLYYAIVRWCSPSRLCQPPSCPAPAGINSQPSRGAPSACSPRGVEKIPPPALNGKKRPAMKITWHTPMKAAPSGKQQKSDLGSPLGDEAKWKRLAGKKDAVGSEAHSEGPYRVDAPCASAMPKRQAGPVLKRETASAPHFSDPSSTLRDPSPSLLEQSSPLQCSSSPLLNPSSPLPGSSSPFLATSPDSSSSHSTDPSLAASEEEQPLAAPAPTNFPDKEAVLDHRPGKKKLGRPRKNGILLAEGAAKDGADGTMAWNFVKSNKLSRVRLVPVPPVVERPVKAVRPHQMHGRTRQRTTENFDVAASSLFEVDPESEFGDGVSDSVSCVAAVGAPLLYAAARVVPSAFEYAKEAAVGKGASLNVGGAQGEPWRCSRLQAHTAGPRRDASSAVIESRHFAHDGQARRLVDATNKLAIREVPVVLVKRSPIAGLGLFAARRISAGSRIIEYCGEIVGNLVADRRERQYALSAFWRNSCYLFRIGDDQIVDATVRANAGRFINHSCRPNCEAHIVHGPDTLHAQAPSGRILISALRDIEAGEELLYDYKFNRTDEGDFVHCRCASASCRRRMN